MVEPKKERSYNIRTVKCDGFYHIDKGLAEVVVERTDRPTSMQNSKYEIEHRVLESQLTDEVVEPSCKVDAVHADKIQREENLIG